MYLIVLYNTYIPTGVYSIHALVITSMHYDVDAVCTSCTYVSYHTYIIHMYIYLEYLQIASAEVMYSYICISIAMISFSSLFLASVPLHSNIVSPSLSIC